MAEPSAHNRRVGGSSPSRGTTPKALKSALAADHTRRMVAMVYQEARQLHSWRMRLALMVMPSISKWVLDTMLHRISELEATVVGLRTEALMRFHMESARALAEGKKLPTLADILGAMEKSNAQDGDDAIDNGRGQPPPSSVPGI